MNFNDVEMTTDETSQDSTSPSPNLKITSSERIAQDFI